MPYSYKLNVFLTQTGVVLFLKVAHPPPRDGQIPPLGGIPPRLGSTALNHTLKIKCMQNLRVEWYFQLFPVLTHPIPIACSAVRTSGAVVLLHKCYTHFACKFNAVSDKG